MGSIEILGGLYIKPGMKIDRYETEKSHIALWSNLSEYLYFFYVWKLYKIQIDIDLKFSTQYELLCACL